ncbi:unnamed protein product, partial [marine sediment metagenome]
IIEGLVRTIKSDFKLIVTDNGSDEEYRNKLKELSHKDYDRVEFHFNDRNEGYISVHNKVASKLKDEDFFCVLNDDLTFKEVGWDLRCIEELKENPKLAEVGLIGPETFNVINAEGSGCLGKTVEYIEGSFIFMPSSIVKEVIESRGSLFSNEYDFIYAEDSDLSLTLRERSYEIKLLPLKVEHKRFERKVNEKLGGGKYYDKKNRETFCRKWAWYLKHRKFERTILLKRERGYGDILFLTPFIKTLKVNHPACKVYIKTACPQA